MRSAFLAFGLLSLVGAASAQLTPADRLEDGQLLRRAHGRDYAAVPGRVSFRLIDEGTSAGELLAGLAAADGRLADAQLLRRNALGIADVAFPDARAHAEVIDALMASGQVHFAEPVFVGEYVGTPDDEFFTEQWNLLNNGQTGGTIGADVRAVEAWAVEDGDADVVIAVLDSGSNWQLTELADSIWDNVDETLNGLDDDANGFVDDVRGWNFSAGTNDPNGIFSHGTNVASVIGSRANNGEEIAGVAAGATDGEGCTIMPLNVGNLAPEVEVLDDAILYAMENGAQVITLSLVVPPSLAVEQAAAAAHAAGVFLDCASGNSFGPVTFPATLPTIMAVGATDASDQVTAFSNKGPEVEIAAPGDFVPVLNLAGDTVLATGTSFSAPHVAAAAGLALSINPALTNEEVRALIMDSARDIGATPDAAGAGCLDLGGLVELAVDSLPITQPEVTNYGTGLAGLGGAIPQIGLSGGRPVIGNARLAVTLSDARPTAMSYLALGFGDADMPLLGGTLLVDLSPPGKLVPRMTDGLGEARQPARLADDPALVGLEVFLQWAVMDPDAEQGTAFSDGLALVLGG